MDKSEIRELMWEFLLECVEEQIESGVPAATGETFRRLIREGHPPNVAKRLIGTIVLRELMLISPKLNPGKPPTELYGDEFAERLDLLPNCPFILED